LAHTLARESQKSPILACETPPSIHPPAASIDSDLARVVAAWPELPAPIRRAIVAAMEAALPAG
jgi:hypothetical protein